MPDEEQPQDPSTESSAEPIDARSPDSEAESSPPEGMPTPESDAWLGRFLDRLYGVLFLPQETFAHLRSHPDVGQAAAVISLVNLLETLRLGQALWQIPFSVIGGLLGWGFFTLLLQQLANVFQKSLSLKELLTLTGFASMPWILIGPALSLFAPLRILVALAVIIWFIIWQIWAASVAFGTSGWRVFAIVPLAVAGGVVTLIWLSNFIRLIFSIAS